MRRKEGKPIKVSHAVAAALDEVRLRDESYDSCLRRLFGLRDKKGREQRLQEFYAVVFPDGRIAASALKSEAKGAAIQAGVKAKIRDWPVLRVREVPQ